VKLLIYIFTIVAWSVPEEWFLPVNINSRKAESEIRLTPIGQFGMLRKARKGIPEHFHTGIDIARPKDNYINEPIFPVHKGLVVSLRDDGPFAQIIIEHDQGLSRKLWTVYEHVSGLRCTLGQRVFPRDTIARYFSKEELQHYGWQFDHLHFEIMKTSPVPVQPRNDLPSYRFTTFALTCYTKELLHKRMIDPVSFFK
jgi:murein DD-endopeptidase MepM/ murein hydrolase activator NlpD